MMRLMRQAGLGSSTSSSSSSCVSLLRRRASFATTSSWNHRGDCSISTWTGSRSEGLEVKGSSSSRRRRRFDCAVTGVSCTVSRGFFFYSTTASFTAATSSLSQLLPQSTTAGRNTTQRPSPLIRDTAGAAIGIGVDQGAGLKTLGQRFIMTGPGNGVNGANGVNGRGGEWSEKHRVAVIGSGNWGTTISKIVAESTAENPHLFEPEVKMWVHEETYKLPETHSRYSTTNSSALQEMTLTQFINTIHENPKYLPNITLPTNIHACSNLRSVVENATIIIFNVPHQFVRQICDELKGHVLPHARGISCIKGVAVEVGNIELYTDTISRTLGIYCGALSGANIATEIALEKFAETTVAYAPPPNDAGLHPLPPSLPPVTHPLLKTLFHRPYFHVRLTTDVPGVSLSGALKNIVALATGFVDGLSWGDNAKAAIIRIGLLEMVHFGKRYFSSCRTSTFTEESCGVADLITSCNGGRNHKCAKLAVERGVSVDEVERTELNGQLAQGIGTTREVFRFLNERGDEKCFPLFVAVYWILEGRRRAEELPGLIEGGLEGPGGR